MNLKGSVCLGKVKKEHISQTKKRERKKETKLLVSGLIYVSPFLILLLVFLFYPIVKTFYFSFFNVLNGGQTEEFVGLKHYITLMKSKEFRQSLWVSLLFILYTVPLELIISFFLAVLASEKLKGINFFRTIFSSTLGVSVAAGSAIFLFFFHPSIGVINTILGFVGIPDQDWLTNPKLALPAVALASVWMHIGINFIIMLTGVQNIPNELYESAKVDGANFFQRIRLITLPMTSPVIFFLLIIGVINSFESFGQIDILTQGGPVNSTNLIIYSIYQDAFHYGSFGYASAQAVVLFVIMLIVTLIQFKLGEKKVHYQ